MFNAVIDAPFGKIGIRTEAGRVREIVYVPESVRSIDPDNALALRVARQIDRYLDRASARFKLPLAEVGSAFQQRVWQAISEVAPWRPMARSPNASAARRARSGRLAARTGSRW